MSKLPSFGPSLTHHLVENRRQMQRQASSSSFARSGASVVAPGMWASDDFDGVDRTHLGTSGWALGSTDGGPSYFVLNGIDVFADLTAKDAALAAQQADLAATVADIAALTATVVVPAAFDTSSSGFATTSAWVTEASQTLTVPAGFTKAMVIANAHMGIANNSSPAVDAYMFVRAVINSVGGPSNGVIGTPPTTMLACFSASFTSLVSGLSAGGTFTVDCQIFTSGLPAYAGNNARIEGAVIWFR